MVLFVGIWCGSHGTRLDNHLNVIIHSIEFQAILRVSGHTEPAKEFLRINAAAFF